MAVTERVFERHRTGLQQAIQNAETNLRSQLKDAARWFLSQPPVHFLSMAHKFSENFGTIAIAFPVYV